VKNLRLQANAALDKDKQQVTPPRDIYHTNSLRNPLLLASAVFGAVFVAGLIVCWVFVIMEAGLSESFSITPDDKKYVFYIW